MAPRIAIIGGGSYQWVPKLLVDLANTPALHEAEIVLEDIDPAPLPPMLDLVEHIASTRGIGLTGSTTTDQRAAIEGADYVVASISTGGFDSMNIDLEIPEHYGIRQSVGDSVGPGGIIRALRNIPIFTELAHNMEELCPDAWLLNLSNPMTTISRAVTRESSITTIGLCHEVTIMQFTLSLLLDAKFFDVSPTVAGVNHLPFITALDVGGNDGLAMLTDLVEHIDERGGEPLSMPFPEGLGHEKISEGPDWTKGDLVAAHRVKLELLARFGVLPAAGDRHVVEFFPGFLTEDSQWGERWGIKLTSIDEREYWAKRYRTEFDEMLASPEVSAMPSGEMVAPIIVCHREGMPGAFPLNLPNRGQVPDLPDDVVVESMGLVDGDGPRGRDVAALPPIMAEYLRRVSTAQELTVEAALTGDRDTVFEAMLADPLAGRTDYDALGRMVDEMLAGTSRWLPQFV